MKSKFTKLVGGVFLSLFMVPSIALADAVPTTLASWTFDTGYDVASNVYTPNNELAPGTKDADAIWTWGQQILPNTYIGTQSDYYMSGQTARYWYLKQHWYNSDTNYGPYMFQIVNDTEASDISDYTDASQHTNYFEISFPTLNYKDITLSYKVASGSSSADEMTVVYSTDDGTTWGVVGTTSTSENWWVYTSDTKELIGTANKSNVMIRIFAANGVKTNWNIDDVVVTGEYATEFTPEYTLTTSVSPASAGTITRSINAASYEENTVVLLNAIPNLGFAFVEWQDGLGNQLSTTNPYDVTMTENKTVVAVFAVAPIAAGTEITAANWTFNTGYEVVGGIYTPNGSDFAVGDWAWSDAQFAANSTYCPSGYVAAVKRDRAWRFDTRGGQNTLCLYSQGGTANDISDYTDGSKHNQYYQFAFPTLGLTDIKVSFAYTYYDSRDGKLELVYSTDGGTTWVDTQAYDTGSDANHFATHSDISIPVGGKDNVIVRLIQSNGVLDYCYLDYFTVKGKIATAPVTVSAVKYATYYNTVPVMLPEGLQAATVDGETSGKLTLNYRYAAGNVIPAETPVLLKAEAGKDYDLTYVANDETAAPAGNLLRGTAVAKTTDGGTSGDKYYALMTGANGVGFYWAAADGAAFAIGANKAWLVLTPSSARFFSLEDETTGIDSVTRDALTNGKVYNLQGQEARNAKGIVIVNGKKVIMK